MNLEESDQQREECEPKVSDSGFCQLARWGDNRNQRTKNQRNPGQRCAEYWEEEQIQAVLNRDEHRRPYGKRLPAKRHTARLKDRTTASCVNTCFSGSAADVRRRLLPSLLRSKNPAAMG